jgi:integrase
MNRWIEHDVKQTRRPSTVESYERMVQDHINPRIGGISLKKLNALHVEAWLSDLERSALGAARRNRCFMILRLVMQKAVAQKLVRDNPTDGVTPPKPCRREAEPLSGDQVKHLLKCAKNNPYEAFFVVAIGTGMRWGEIAALRWSDIDLNAGTLQVQRTLSQARGKILIQPPKTKAGRRKIPLPAFVLAALHRHRSKSPVVPHPTAWVFPNRRGGLLGRGNFFSCCWKPLRDAAGIPKTRFHDLRHTTATLLLQNGVHPKVVQTVLGHSRFGITMDLYSHMVDGMQNEAAIALDSAISVPREK